MDNKVKYQVKFIKENNRTELLNRISILDRFFSGTDHRCTDCSEGDLCTEKQAKPSSSKSWSRQGNEIIAAHLNIYHGHKYQVKCINIRRRKACSESRQRKESVSQAAAQCSPVTANHNDALASQQPVEIVPPEAILLSDRLKSMTSHLIELSNDDTANWQLNEQFKQQLSIKIGELKNKLDLVSHQYNLANDFQCRTANASNPITAFGQPSNTLPMNTFILIPVSFTQPSVGPTLNQLNQTSGALRGLSQPEGLVANRCQPNNSPVDPNNNRAIVGHQLGRSNYPNLDSCRNFDSFAGHFLCDDNFTRVRDLEDIHQNRASLNSIIQQQKLSMSARSKPELASPLIALAPACGSRANNER